MATTKKTGTEKTTTIQAPVRGGQVTTASAWRKSSTDPIELPSGNVAKIRSASMEFFLTGGFIPNSLKGLVHKMINDMESEQGKPSKKDSGDSTAELSEIITDDNKLRDLIHMYDRIAAHCFEEPKVALPPEDPDDREDDILYTDEIGMDDKVFVFNVALGGTKDVESFRNEQAAAVESVRAGTEVADPTE